MFKFILRFLACLTGWKGSPPQRYRYVVTALVHTLTYGVGAETRSIPMTIDAYSEDAAASAYIDHFNKMFWVTRINLNTIKVTNLGPVGPEEKDQEVSG